MAPRLPRIVVHSLAHAKAAFAAAASSDVPIVLASAPGAGASVGPLWFRMVIEKAQQAHPGVVVRAVLDCGNEPGIALAALRTGIRHIRFTGRAETRGRLTEIAAALGAEIEHGPEPAALDLLDHPDPETACRAWIAGNKTPD